MNKHIKNYFGIIGIVALVFLILILFWYVSAFSRSIMPARSFSVSAEGEITAVPDIAELSFGVLTEGGKNLADLQKENTGKANRIIDFLKKSGVDGKDIKTRIYAITPRYQYFSCPPQEGGRATACPPPEIAGYSINQSVLVKIRALHTAGDIVAGVVEEGANTVSGPSFTIDDPALFQQKAREEAMKKAKEKARRVAKAGGFRVGRLISVNEGFLLPQPVFAERFLTAKGGEGITSPELESGSQEVKVNITLVYEIK